MPRIDIKDYQPVFRVNAELNRRDKPLPIATQLAILQLRKDQADGALNKIEEYFAANPDRLAQTRTIKGVSYNVREIAEKAVHRIQGRSTALGVALKSAEGLPSKPLRSLPTSEQPQAKTAIDNYAAAKQVATQPSREFDLDQEAKFKDNEKVGWGWNTKRPYRTSIDIDHMRPSPLAIVGGDQILPERVPVGILTFLGYPAYDLKTGKSPNGAITGEELRRSIGLESVAKEVDFKRSIQEAAILLKRKPKNSRDSDVQYLRQQKKGVLAGTVEFVEGLRNLNATFKHLTGTSTDFIIKHASRDEYRLVGADIDFVMSALREGRTPSQHNIDYAKLYSDSSEDEPNPVQVEIQDDQIQLNGTRLKLDPQSNLLIRGMSFYHDQHQRLSIIQPFVMNEVGESTEQDDRFKQLVAQTNEQIVTQTGVEEFVRFDPITEERPIQLLSVRKAIVNWLPTQKQSTSQHRQPVTPANNAASLFDDTRGTSHLDTLYANNQTQIATSTFRFPDIEVTTGPDLLPDQISLSNDQVAALVEKDVVALLRRAGKRVGFSFGSIQQIAPGVQLNTQKQIDAFNRHLPPELQIVAGRDVSLVQLILQRVLRDNSALRTNPEQAAEAIDILIQQQRKRR